ncbi:kelch-like protein 40b [Vanessa cardui]|uniref:kelch-like protein 40b n=1 Tax=Vanessa cardui TaxID=171605 RepID=UPI001F13839E|nr:kelch-like protein 40b [Vanessa cardui]
MDEITLQIRDKVFQVKKDVLCEHSDYFRAMFSGNYVENEQKQICIDMLDPNTMSIILHYMQIGLIDLSVYPLSTIKDITIAANFLQITELIKQIEYTLDIGTCESNWMETMDIAEISCFPKLEKYCVAFGLFSFKSMKPEYVPNIHKLAWYLSHPYLDTQSELEVFNFGLEWIFHTETGADALLVIIGCLDMKKVTTEDLEEIKKCMKGFENSLAAKVIDLLYELSVNQHDLSETILNKQKDELCEKFTQRVWTETLDIVKESKTRCLQYTPVIPLWLLKDGKPELLPHSMYTYYQGRGFEQWLEVADKNLWGWSVVAWGLTKLVIVCGEHGRGTGMFMRDIKVYDTLRKEWTRHGVILPQRRHAGLAVIGDSLYIAGGVGGFRVVLDTAIVYDLKQRSFRKIAHMPDALQNPALCSHNNKVYAAGQKSIYCHEDSGTSDQWKKVVDTEMRMSCIRSCKEYIYCIQGYFSNLYRFMPGVDKNLQLITYFSSLPATICNLGETLYIFTWTICGQCDVLTVEEYKGKHTVEKPKVLFTQSDNCMRVNDVAGSCSLVMTAPPLYKELSKYHKRYLARYPDPV